VSLSPVTAPARSRNKRDLIGDFLVVRAGSELDGGVRTPALPERVRPPLGVVSVLAAAVVVVLGVLYAGDPAGTDFDAAVRGQLLDLHSPWRQIALIVDYTGEPVGFTLTLVILVVTFLRMRHRRAAVLAVVGTGVAAGATTALKPLVDRTINDGFLSYPSGHTATATSFALVTALVVVQRRNGGAARGTLIVTAIVVPVAVLMAWAQVLLNAHYPTDTIGGFCTALAVVPPTAWAVDRVADRTSRAATRT
jgi:undecaprenyl-diphosphatase